MSFDGVSYKVTPKEILNSNNKECFKKSKRGKEKAKINKTSFQ